MLTSNRISDTPFFVNKKFTPRKLCSKLLSKYLKTPCRHKNKRLNPPMCSECSAAYLHSKSILSLWVADRWQIECTSQNISKK